MAKYTTPIKYFGGKSNMFNNILKYFPNKEDYNTYIEPFGGSFSVGLKKGITEIEIYNDLEKNVYSLYKVLSDKDLYTIFKEKCDLAVYSDDFRNEYKKKLKEDLDIVDRAFYFFYVNRTSHNGIGGFSINTVVRRNMSKSISDFLSSIDRMDELHHRLSRVIISNTDGIELIKRFDRPNVFFYCDPPYEQSTRTITRYAVDMNEDKHKEFLNVVLNSQAKILISGYDCELYDVLTENNFEKISFDVNTITGNYTKKVKKEYLWKNY
jgi:DNA adenine methylase